MLPKRPLLYLSLPGIAIVLGLIWIRRKKKIHCDTGGKTASVHKNDAASDIKETEKLSQQTISGPTRSLRIQNGVNTSHQKQDLADIKLGKSAPIDINRISPVKLTNQQIDAEILKVSKIDDKPLKSINEQEFESLSPIDLPDSGERKRFSTKFTFRKDSKKSEPVVVKATTTPKVSPKDSFIETKYTENPIATPVLNNNNEIIKSNTKSDDTKLLEKMNDNSTKSDRNELYSSPPVSLCSLQSNDSGKGSSPPRSEGLPIITYEFLLAHVWIAHLLGRKGAFVNKIKATTGATVLVKKHTTSHKVKVVALEGTQVDVDAALAIIKKKFPAKQFPTISFERVYFASTISNGSLPPPVDVSVLQLQLIEGMNNDVIISSISNGGHIFVQQPLHPSYPSLNVLNQCMNQSYALCDSPLVPELTNDIICVACVQNSWYRVQIMTQGVEADTCIAKYLDYGGYVQVHLSDLRQIRADFMLVPFQAIECVLANIQPTEPEWDPSASSVISTLTNGAVVQAQVIGYSNEGIPEIYLYSCLAPENIIFINKELVARKLASWVEDNCS